MRKSTIIMLSMAIVAGLSGCGNADISNKKEPAKTEKTLYDHGLDLVELMEEMVESDAYRQVYTASGEIQEVLAKAAEGEYDEPKAVYEIMLTEQMLQEFAELQGFEDMSEELQQYMNARTASALASQINGAAGVNAVAASSICTAGKTFVNADLDGLAVYLYTYDHGAPAFVVFREGEDDTVSANSTFIFNEEFKTDTSEEIEEFFSEISASVKLVK